MTVTATSSTAQRILVFGSPNWRASDTAAVRAALRRVWRPDAVLVVAVSERGAAALVVACWERWGGQVEEHQLNWTERGVVAPRKRRDAMIAGGAALCLGFPCGSTCVEEDLAAVEAAGIRTRLVRAR